MMRRKVMTLGVMIFAMTAAALGQASDEVVARRQLESGRAFAKQGNYTEALKDFKAVAETHASSAVADDALLEMARYYIDVAGDKAAAAAAVDAIVKKYATSDSAPEAYLLAGRLALARSRQAVDLDAAAANFERVFRLFPASPAVPRALSFIGETMWYAGRPEDARASLGRVIAEFPLNDAAADAYLTVGRVLVALGEPVMAMEELQQVRNRWPTSPAAAVALEQTTLLHRLYVRARTGPAFSLSPNTIGPAKLQNVLALAFSGTSTLHFATESGLGILTPDAPERPQSLARPRGLVVDRAAQIVPFDAGALRPGGAGPLVLAVAQSGGSSPKPLTNLKAAVQFTNGDWLVADGDDRSLQRFSETGNYVGAFSPGRMTRLAITATDSVVGLDRDQKAVLIFDGSGRLTSRIPLQAAGYDLKEAEDVAVDVFGHVYVLDRDAIAVFSPYPAAATTAPASPAAGTPANGPAAVSYRLVTLFAPPQNDPAAFRRAKALAVDPTGALFVFDDRAERVLVYR